MARENESNRDAAALERMASAYSRFVPHQFLELMGRSNVADVLPGDSVEMIMTLLFSDIRGFTTLSEAMTPEQNFRFINEYLTRMEPAINRFGGIIDKYMGDAIMALFPNGADSALDASLAMGEALATHNRQRQEQGKPVITVGSGLNTGLVMLGTVGGQDRLEGTVISDAVNLAARIEAMTKTYRVSLLISEHTLYSLQEASRHDIRFLDRVTIRGKEQPQSVYEVFDGDAPAERAAKRETRLLFEEGLACYHFKDVDRAQELLERCLEACPGDQPARVYLERCERFRKTGAHEGTGEVDLNIDWTPQLAVGHDLIDEQHRELFACVHRFVEGVRSGRDYAQARPVIDFLDDYVHKHFATEERCMEISGYPFLSVQQHQHRQFSRYFANLKREIADTLSHDQQFLLFRIQVFIVDWLVTHTAKLDGHFGRFLRLCEEED